jgi:hypothetical protein
MVVCAHGDVAGFCEKHEMQILECYIGYLEDYHKSNCAVIVTDQVMTRQEYDSLKCTLFARGVELVSTEWTDDEVILRLLHNQIQNRGKRGGRQTFGFMKKNGQIVEIPKLIYVARRIIELRDSGMTLKEIQNFPEIHHLDYKKISTSTIQQIIKNRERYEK